jgi:hypothetical protein
MIKIVANMNGKRKELFAVCYIFKIHLRDTIFNGAGIMMRCGSGSSNMNAAPSGSGFETLHKSLHFSKTFSADNATENFDYQTVWHF